MSSLSRFSTRRGLLALAACALVACGGDDESANATSTSSGDPPPPAKAAFVADAAVTGARLWLEVPDPNDGGANVEVWGAELGGVFGYAAHLRYDGAHLTLDAADAPASDEAALAPADPAEAVHAWTPRPGDVGFGGTRRSPDLGEVAIDTPTRLGHLRFAALAPATSTLSIERVALRRADGSWVAVATAGGKLTTTGGAQ